MGTDHPEVAKSLDGLAKLSYRQGAYFRAEELGTQALHIRRQKLGSHYPEIVQNLHGRALSLAAQKDYKKQNRYLNNVKLIFKYTVRE